jgi:ferredoxin--NADP+ reductase
MMKAVSELTRPFGVPTTVSLNAIMVDGTGMCGGCRVSVDGETRYACVEGPEFDGHAVDFAMLSDRLQTYRIFEQEALEHRERCRVGLKRPEPAPAAAEAAR